MADYIKKSILAESYVHLYYADFDEESIQKYEAIIVEFSQSIIRGIYDKELVISLQYDISSGSFKSKVLVIGTIIIIVGHYGSFWAGVEKINEHSRDFAQMVNNKVIEETKYNDPSSYHREIRLGVPGVLKNIAHDIDSIRKRITEMSPNEVSRRLEEIRQRTVRLSDRLEVDEGNLIRSEIDKYIEQNIPPDQPDPSNDIIPKQQPIRPKDDDLDGFLNDLAKR